MITDAFVITSEVTIDAEDAGLLAAAFQARVRLVEAAPGFQRIEVWSDLARPGVFLMVSWWDTADAFRAYMRSEDHRISHARIAGPPHKPRGTGVRRFGVLPDMPSGSAAPGASAAPLRCPVAALRQGADEDPPREVARSSSP